MKLKELVIDEALSSRKTQNPSIKANHYIDKKTERLIPWELRHGAQQEYLLHT
jgi:hypothetical protein